MPSLDEAINALRAMFEKQKELYLELDKITSERSIGEQFEREVDYLRGIREKKQEIRDYLYNELLRYPPAHYRRHSEELKKFHCDAGYDQSIFIMTKFPEVPGTEDDRILDKVIQEVKAAIKTAGYEPRIAQFSYHEWLWENVELYLVGCARGIAIVQDRVKPELNPNVALEWGWMKGMSKRVLFLAEEKFAHERADWNGLIKATFSWENPGEGIRKGVAGWLQEKEKIE